MAWLKARRPRIEQTLQGGPLILVENGGMFRDRMKAAYVDEQDILTNARTGPGSSGSTRSSSPSSRRAGRSPSSPSQTAADEQRPGLLLLRQGALPAGPPLRDARLPVSAVHAPGCGAARRREDEPLRLYQQPLEATPHQGATPEEVCLYRRESYEVAASPSAQEGVFFVSVSLLPGVCDEHDPILDMGATYAMDVLGRRILAVRR